MGPDAQRLMIELEPETQPLTFQNSDSLMLPLPLSHCISLKHSWSVPRLLTKKDLCGKVKEAGGGDRQFMGREKNRAGKIKK